MATHRTNDQMLRAFLKEVNNDMLVTCVLRERLMKMADMTRQAMAKNPESFDNPVFNRSYYVAFCDLVDKHLKQ